MASPSFESVGAEPHEGPVVTRSPGYRPRDRWRFMNSTPDIMRHLTLTSVPVVSRSRVLLVGARRDARRLIRRLGKSPWNGPPIVGFVDAGHSRSSSLRTRNRHFALHSQTDPVPVLGPVDRLDELVDLARATHVVVAVSGKTGPRSRPQVSQLINSDVVVQWVLVDSARLDLASLTASSTATTWSLHSVTPPRAHVRLPRWDRLTGARSLKRIVDSTIAVFALLVLTPLFALVALSILVTTGRPIFYTQDRVGQGGQLFRIIKFRSMRCDAESETGPIWASDHDTRCTRIGDWLRHTNIDELPQLLNVLRGEMSLVGPRPERPSFVERFRQTVPDYDLRHAVPGGMTGWAQVHGWRGRTSLRKRVQYDLDYIERWSPGLDLRILLMTVQHVFWGKTSWNESKRSAKTSS
jgi:exopolysaccharide biosynthesis polyprenyl glycosylphosphotransferase